MKTEDSQKYSAYFQRYIDKVNHMSLEKAFDDSHDALISYIEGLSEERLNYAYDNGKWTIAQVLMHTADTERIMAYRALRFARNDKTELLGFDENQMADELKGISFSKAYLIENTKAVRQSTRMLFDSLSKEERKREGQASGNWLPVEGVGYLICGHQTHHLEVLKERYS